MRVLRRVWLQHLAFQRLLAWRAERVAARAMRGALTTTLMRGAWVAWRCTVARDNRDRMARQTWCVSEATREKLLLFIFPTQPSNIMSVETCENQYLRNGGISIRLRCHFPVALFVGNVTDSLLLRYYCHHHPAKKQTERLLFGIQVFSSGKLGGRATQENCRFGTLPLGPPWKEVPPLE